MAITCAPFYDVERAVGSGAPNARSDVMLVQYFLFSILVDDSWPMSIGPVIPPAGALQAIHPCDGTFRPELVNWIRTFQTEANGAGLGPLTVDGRVSHGGAAWGRTKPRAGKWYCIHAMNHLLFLSNKQRFLNLISDPGLPGPLRLDLARIVNIDTVP